MKKLWLKIRIFFFYLFRGLQNANDITFTAQKDIEPGADSGIEQQKEVNSVYKDMLKGELTQEVIELRHEMYFAERLSHKYVYTGNGRAVKKNNLFSFSGIDTSDGLPVVLVQKNTEDDGSLMDYGIYNVGINVELDEKAKGDLGTKEKRNFTITINRDFTPRFQIEKFVKKIVVKAIDDEHSLLDLYISEYKSQFDNRDKFFYSEISKIYTGDLRSDVINFTNLSFTTFNAVGVDDFIEFSFNNIKFSCILKYDGSYILRFTADNVEKNDLLDEIYDKKTDEKSKAHEVRKNSTLLFDVAANQEKYDTEQANYLLNELKNN